MSDENLELNMRATLETEDVKKGTKEIEDSIKKMEETNKSAHQQIQAETEKTGGIWTKVFNWSNAVSLVKNGAGMIIDTVKQIGAVVIDFRNAADDSQDAVDALNLQLENMGMYTDETSKKIQDFAEELQDTTNFSNEDILGADTLLLTFRNISEDILPEATERLLDMSAVMEQDLKSSSIQLGKALSDPVEGISALSRVGITFTEQQKESIKKFVEQNDIMSAQKIILNELNAEFGGHAKLQVDAVEQSKNAWQSFKEVLGARLQPVVDAMFTGFSKVLEVMTKVFSPEEKKDDSAGHFQSLIDELETLEGKANKTADEIQRQKDVMNDIAEIAPGIVTAYDAEGNAALNLRDAISELSKMRVKELQARKVQLEEMEKSAKAKLDEKEALKKQNSDAKTSMQNPKEVYKFATQDYANTNAVNSYKDAYAMINKNLQELEKLKKEDRIDISDYEEKKSRYTKAVEILKTAEQANNNNLRRYNKEIIESKKELEGITKEKEGVNAKLKFLLEGGDSRKIYGNDDDEKTGGTGKSEVKLDSSKTLEQQIQDVKNKAEIEKIAADEYQKQIIDINTNRDIAILTEELKLKEKIDTIKSEYESTNDENKKKKLQKQLIDAQDTSRKIVHSLNYNAATEIDAVKSKQEAEAEVEKKAEEKQKHAKENRAEKREIQRDRTEQYRLSNPELPGVSTDILKAEKRKEQAVWEEHYDILEKMEEGHLSYREIAKSKLEVSEKKRLEQIKMSMDMEKSFHLDKKKFQNMLGNTATGLADKLISGEIKSGKQMKELMKTNMKAFLVDSGQRHSHKALEEGAEAISRLAAHDYEGATTHGIAAVEHAGVAAAAGVAASRIKIPSSSDSNTNSNLPGSSVSASNKKELVINTDNQAVIRLLIPEFAQALDDGYSISKK